MQEAQETRVQSLGGEDPLEEEMAIHSSILSGKSHGQRSLVGYSLWGPKESDTTGELTLSRSYVASIRKEGKGISLCSGRHPHL